MFFYLLLFLGSFAFYLANPFDNKCTQDDCKNGYGVYVRHSGIKYEGEWKNGLRHGRGTLAYPDNYTYVGEWENNRMHGQGIKTFSNGSRYEGKWKNGHQHGHGIFINPNIGRKYKGEWKTDTLIQVHSQS